MQGSWKTANTDAVNDFARAVYSAKEKIMPEQEVKALSEKPTLLK